MITDSNKNHGLDDQYSIINQGNQGSMQDGANKSPILDDLNSIMNQRNRGSKSENNNKIQKELDTTAQPAEEHLITEADNLHNNDFQQNSNKSSLGDRNWGSDEINPENKPLRPLVD